MKAEDLKRNALAVTAGINHAMQTDKTGETYGYIMECLGRFFAGDFGDVPEEDAEANRAELTRGEGRALARYPARKNLAGAIYIQAYFSTAEPGDLERNNTLVMYCDDY